ncbi:MAG: putative rane protein [Candidatus Saccharibacteria bacterium]|jgi:hypothetical protein|nr:putative rane protein [Candidatus Saccharibacteria bacterium]
MINIPKRIRLWLALALGSTLLVGVVYAAQHQQNRQNADRPLLQLAGNGMDSLKGGQSTASIVGETQAEAASSTEPFVSIYDTDGKLLVAGAKYQGNDIDPPAGTFEYAKKHSPHTFTWEPRRGLRLAAALVYDRNVGYVLAASNLHETELDQYRLLVLSALSLAVLVAASAAVARVLR